LLTMKTVAATHRPFDDVFPGSTSAILARVFNMNQRLVQRMAAGQAALYPDVVAYIDHCRSLLQATQLRERLDTMLQTALASGVTANTLYSHICHFATNYSDQKPPQQSLLRPLPASVLTLHRLGKYVYPNGVGGGL